MIERAVQDVLKRAERLAKTSQLRYSELAAAHADKTDIDQIANTLRDLISVCADEAMKESIAEELALLENKLRNYEDEPTVTAGFFRQPQVTVRDETPAIPGDPAAFLTARITWRLSKLDLDHPQCWCDVESGQALRKVLARLGSIEELTWREIDNLSKHNHEWEDWSTWTGGSRKRLETLDLDDQPGWYQIQIDRLGRLFGFRIGTDFYVVWWDRDHEVYETGG